MLPCFTESSYCEPCVSAIAEQRLGQPNDNLDSETPSRSPALQSHLSLGSTAGCRRGYTFIALLGIMKIITSWLTRMNGRRKDCSALHSRDSLSPMYTEVFSQYIFIVSRVYREIQTQRTPIHVFSMARHSRVHGMLRLGKIWKKTDPAKAAGFWQAARPSVFSHKWWQACYYGEQRVTP